MSDFAHLHVASGFSMRYGSATPQALVERAAQYGQSALALTDRDGLYGAIRFVQAATKAGIAAVLGVDLAMSGGLLDPPPDPAQRPVRRAPRAPARGGALVDPRLPRVTVLAVGSGAGGPGAPRGRRRRATWGLAKRRRATWDLGGQRRPARRGMVGPVSARDRHPPAR